MAGLSHPLENRKPNHGKSRLAPGSIPRLIGSRWSAKFLIDGMVFTFDDQKHLASTLDWVPCHKRSVVRLGNEMLATTKFPCNVYRHTQRNQALRTTKCAQSWYLMHARSQTNPKFPFTALLNLVNTQTSRATSTSTRSDLLTATTHDVVEHAVPDLLEHTSLLLDGFGDAGDAGGHEVGHAGEVHVVGVAVVGVGHGQDDGVGRGGFDFGFHDCLWELLILSFLYLYY